MKTIAHVFDVEEANEYGVYPAILLHHIRYWITKNQADGTHCYDGRTWMPAPVPKLVSTFPYMTKDVIRRALELLRERGVLQTGKFNRDPKDQTRWYAFVDEQEYLPSSESPSPKNGGNPQLACTPSGTKKPQKSPVGTDANSAAQLACTPSADGTVAISYKEDESLNESLSARAREGSPVGSAGDGQPTGSEPEAIKPPAANAGWKAGADKIRFSFTTRDFEKIIEPLTAICDADGILTLGALSDQHVDQFSAAKALDGRSARQVLVDLLGRQIEVRVWTEVTPEARQRAAAQRRSKRLMGRREQAA